MDPSLIKQTRSRPYPGAYKMSIEKRHQRNLPVCMNDMNRTLTLLLKLYVRSSLETTLNPFMHSCNHTITILKIKQNKGTYN